jgi:hypothetical protein
VLKLKKEKLLYPSIIYITFLSSARVLLPSQESRTVNRENAFSLVTSLHSEIELNSFLGIVVRYLLVFVDVAFYKTGPVPLLLQECYVKWRI